MRVPAIAVGVAVSLVASCKRDAAKAPAPVVADGSGSAAAPDPLDPSGLRLTTSDETTARVKAVFPNGPATEDVRAQLGTVPAPLDIGVPQPDSEWIATIVPPPGATTASVRKALPRHTGAAHSVMGRSAGKWIYVEDDKTGAVVDELAIVVALIDDQDATPQDQLASEETWASAVAKALGAKPPAFAMTPVEAHTKALAALVGARLLGDDHDIGLAVMGPKGRPIEAKLVWDALYSAGFTWGDGDYFHWVPSEDTDDSQGIELGATSGTGYFSPEQLEPVEGVEMSFDVARTWHPAEMLDVMVRISQYLAKRFGGTVIGDDGRPFDAAVARKQLDAIVDQLGKAGMTPGSELALQAFVGS